jgi:glycerol uptake facilitator protein
MKEYIAEFIATFALIFIGAGAILANVGIIGIALAHGLVLMSMIYATGHVSGAHINPAVTISMWVTKRIESVKAIGYIISQLLGAVVGALFLRIIFSNAQLSLNLGTPGLNGVSFWVGILIEFILTFLLVFTIFGTSDKRAPKGIYGVAIGLVLTFDILVGGNLTGAAMNPARVFGPALISGFWNHHIVYWIGPVLGALLAGLVYDNLLLENKQ